MQQLRRTTPHTLCLTVAGIATLLKCILATSVPASALFAEDYNYLNIAINYARGEAFFDSSYPFIAQHSGLAYFLLISPWLWFAPEHRMLFVFMLNCIMSGVVIYFGGRIICELVGKVVFFPLVLLALFSPVFKFSFYVLTENLLFPLLVVAAFLFTDITRTLQSRSRFAVMLFIIALIPITRAPGLSVIVGCLAVLFTQTRDVSRKKLFVAAAAIIAAALIPYLLYSISYGATREARYGNHVTSVLAVQENWKYIPRFLLSQLMYVFTSALCLLPVFFLLSPRLAELTGQPRKWLNYFYFSFFTAGGLVAFCVVHLVLKLLRVDSAPESQGWFAFGRYDDPATLLVFIGGLAAFWTYQASAFSRTFRWTVCLGTTGLIVAAFAFVTSRTWSSVNQAGLSFFYRSLPVSNLLLVQVLFVIAALVGCWLTFVRGRGFALVVAGFLCFQIVSIEHGMKQTINRANGIHQALEGAYWITQNTSETSLVCFDFRVVGQPAPGAIKRMYALYRAAVHVIYPRNFLPAKTESDFAKCSATITTLAQASKDDKKILWQNKLYAVLGEAGSASNNAAPM